MKGGFSGGTIDSMRAQVEAVQAEKSLRRMVVDPYALSPDRDGEPDLGDERDRVAVFERDLLGGWVGPFVMASFNTRIVRRSNALAGLGLRPRVPLPRAGRLRPRARRRG